MTMESVSKAAHEMIEEVRRLFHEDAGILKGTSRPDYVLRGLFPLFYFTIHFPFRDVPSRSIFPNLRNLLIAALSELI